VTDTPASLAEALALLQTRLPEIKKSETANVRSEKGNYSYTYANLAGISKAILPLLGDVGLSWSCLPTLTAEGKFVLDYALLHVSGESRGGQYPLPTSGTPQAVGGMITYARRYALCAATGVAPEEDDDDAAAASQQEQEGVQAQQRRKTAQRRATRPAANGASNGRHEPAKDAAAPPPLPGEDGYTDEDPTAVTQAQLQRIHATFTDLGVSDRDIRRTVVSHILQRTIGSTKDLARDEAGRLIDELTSLASKEDGALLVADMLREDGAG
jgi:hypothetical protein